MKTLQKDVEEKSWFDGIFSYFRTEEVIDEYAIYKQITIEIIKHLLRIYIIFVIHSLEMKYREGNQPVDRAHVAQTRRKYYKQKQ